MKYRYAYAIGILMTSFTAGTAIAQGADQDQRGRQNQEQRQRQQEEKKQENQQRQQDQKRQQDLKRQEEQNRQHEQNRQREQNRKEEQRRQQDLRRQAERNQQQNQQRRLDLQRQEQNQISRGQWRDLLNRNNQMRAPRPGQQVIMPNRFWVPNRTHVYNSGVYVGLNIWTMSSFNYRGVSRSWDPSNWNYAVEDSLMTLVYRSERMSNALRNSFDRQMNRNGRGSSQNSQAAWNRIRQLDESLQKLRADIGYVSQNSLRYSALNSLAIGRDLGNIFYRDSFLRGMVQYEWQDLLFELNELGRYFGERPL